MVNPNISMLETDSSVAGTEMIMTQDATTLQVGKVTVDAIKTYTLTGITASTTELNYVDITALGTGEASKVLSLDANKTFKIGTLSSANDTSGVPLTATINKVVAINADTGGTALGAGNTRAAAFRFLLGTAITSGADISAYGAECLLKNIVSVNAGGNMGGVLGHFESAGTLTLTGSINTVKAGVASFLDLAANATVAAGTVVSAFGVNPANFGTTMNGRSAIIHVTNPMAGTWGSFLDLSTATGCTQDSAAGATTDKYLKVYINGTLYTIAMSTA